MQSTFREIETAVAERCPPDAERGRVAAVARTVLRLEYAGEPPPTMLTRVVQAVIERRERNPRPPR